jgi:hypothetical protein
VHPLGIHQSAITKRTQHASFFEHVSVSRKPALPIRQFLSLCKSERKSIEVRIKSDINRFSTTATHNVQGDV